MTILYVLVSLIGVSWGCASLLAARVSREYLSAEWRADHERRIGRLH